jgi:hypothetical protein
MVRVYHFVTRINFDQTGKQSNSIQAFPGEAEDRITASKISETLARKRFYNILAADIDNDNYQFELVQIVRDDGIVIASQVFDNREA